MSPNALQSREERGKHYNTLNSICVRPGKHLDKGSVASYQQKDLERAAAELVSIWGKVKNDSPVYLKIERAFTSYNHDVGATCLNVI